MWEKIVNGSEECGIIFYILQFFKEQFKRHTEHKKVFQKNILAKIYNIELNSGDSIFGEKIFEDENIIRLKTNYGEVELNKSDIKSITEKGKKIKDEEVQPLYYAQRPIGLAGLLFGGYTMDKDSDFSLGEEQLIDLFFDPTGYTLDKGTFYLSGFSFAFGITEKLHVSS